MSGPNWEAVNPEMIAQNCSARHIQSVIEDAKRDMAALSEEVKALREAAQAVLENRDKNCKDREEYRETAEYGNFWSPSASMVESFAIAQLRATLARFQENK